MHVCFINQLTSAVLFDGIPAVRYSALIGFVLVCEVNDCHYQQ